MILYSVLKAESEVNSEALLIFSFRLIAVKENNEDLELPMIEMATIVQATNNFSMENMIGVGGFGPVYKVIY